MTDLVKKFVEENIDLIEENKWEEIYQKASDKLKDDTGIFTELMLAANIHPEEYLKELPDYFLSNSNIKEFTIPNKITNIGYSAFSKCRGLTDVIISDGVKSIGRGAFMYCKSLKSITIPNSIISIGENAFTYCENLTSVTIGNSVTSIGENAFYNCSRVTDIIIPDSIKRIGYDAFNGCTELASITVSDRNTKYKSVDGNLYTKDGKTFVRYAVGKTDTSFVIPDGVTSIGEDAFIYGKSLNNVTIPNSVTNIDNSAFRFCISLHVIIPDSVISIGDYAFSGCKKLTIEYNGTKSDWKKIYNLQAFKYTYFTINCIDGTIVKKMR